jgi:hypothetical protein
MNSRHLSLLLLFCWSTFLLLCWRGCQVSEYEDCLVGPHSGNPQIAELCGRILDKAP